MRFKRVFPQDTRGFLYQVDMNKYLRLGQINTVDAEKGTCTINWLDRPGQRDNVQITQAESKTWSLPSKGDVVICGFDIREQARILRYINMGHEVRRTAWELPKLKEGERLWEVGGSMLHMKQSGDIDLFTVTEGKLTLEAGSQTFRVQFANWRVMTDGGSLFFGQVKRPRPNPAGGNTIQTIQNLLQQDLVEFTLKVNETGPSQTDVVVAPTPIIEMTLGTLVDKDGNVVNKLDTINYIATKDVAVRIKLKSGIQMDIDKEGRLTLKYVKMNINEGSVDLGDPDIAYLLESNDGSLGTRGQHVAREHDAVEIPLSASFTDPAHVKQSTKAAANQAALQQLALAIMSPVGPCSFNPALLQGSVKLQGEITEGADSVYLGDTVSAPPLV